MTPTGFTFIVRYRDDTQSKRNDVMQFLRKYGEVLSVDADLTKCVVENSNLAIVVTALNQWAAQDLLTWATETPTLS